MQEQFTSLARAHAHPRDAGIHFHEPTHVYTIQHDARTRYTSVTTFLGSLFHGGKNAFDAPKMAARIAAQPNHKRSKREYWDKTAKELEQMWSANGDLARTLGTAMHLDVERFFNGMPTVAAEQAALALRPPPPPSREMQFFYDWWARGAPEMLQAQEAAAAWAAVAAAAAVAEAVSDDDDDDSELTTAEIVAAAVVPPPPQSKSLEPWRTEWCVYWEEYALAGSIDMVFRDARTGQLAVYDWKRVCKDLTPNGHLQQKWPTGYASAPGLEHVPDTPFWHYALQLNLYKRILESKYGAQVAPPLVLVVMHPDNAAALRIELPEMPDEIDAALAHRQRLLLKKPAAPLPALSLLELACRRARLLGLPEPTALVAVADEEEVDAAGGCCAFAADADDAAPQQQQPRKRNNNCCAFVDDNTPQQRKKKYMLLPPPKE